MAPDTERATVRRLGTPQLTAAESAVIRELLQAAFAGDRHGGFTEDDWQHALGVCISCSTQGTGSWPTRVGCSFGPITGVLAQPQLGYRETCQGNAEWQD